MYAYFLDPTLAWGSHLLQAALGFTLLHLPHDSGNVELAFYWCTAALITIMIALAVLTCREMVMYVLSAPP
jgi:hypothetical protein